MYEKYCHRYSKLNGQKLNGEFDTLERISELEASLEEITQTSAERKSD